MPPAEVTLEQFDSRGVEVPNTIQLHTRSRLQRGLNYVQRAFHPPEILYNTAVI
jgi:hypothetical protein